MEQELINRLMKRLLLKKWRWREMGLSGMTIFWLLVPMPALILLSIITYFTERRMER
ncbi:hypothetical protein [Bacillus infantis]|uniref:hypothetical protein n=1 Tax=Bacillus infantis TaxID=324767 RepID=UPI003CEEFD1E